MRLLTKLLRNPREIALRRWLFQVHLYAGLIVGVYAAVIGITGSALVFQPQMRAWLNRDLVYVHGTGRRVSVDRVLDSVTKARPDFHLMSVRLPYDANETYQVSASHMGGEVIYVNPFDASIVGVGRPTKDFLSWLQQLHFNLLGGPTGRYVNGVGASGLFILSVTGLVIWWPGISNWKRAIGINWKARWKRVNYDIHSAVGFFTVIVLAMFSLTGMYYAWPKQSQNLIQTFSPLRATTKLPGLPKGSSGALLPASTLTEIALQQVPGTWVSGIMFPMKAGQPIKINLMQAGPRQYQYTNYVYLDPHSGAVLRVDEVKGRSFGDTLLAWIPALHFGTFSQNVLVYILWVLLGLSPVALGLSGILMWWNRVLSKRLQSIRNARARLVATASPERATVLQ